MKIAFVYDLIYPYSKGGVEKRIRDLGYQLAARGHDVHIYGTKQWDGPDDMESDGLHLHGVRGSAPRHTKNGARSIAQAVIFACALARRLLHERFDIIDVQNMAPLACLATLATSKVTGSVPVVTWHEVWREYWNSYLGWIGYVGRLAEWMIARLAPNHLAVSRTTMRRVHSLRRAYVGLVPNGVDCAKIKSASPSQLVSDVIYVGRLVDHKNVGFLIDAIASLRFDGFVPDVLITGDGPARALLQQKAASMSLDNVTFLGSPDSELTVYSLLKSAQVFALPSRREGFGLAALEAAAAGLPVVTVDHPQNGATELVIGRAMGRASSPFPAEFASHVRELLEDDELRSILSSNASTAAADFDWSIIAPLAEREYFKVLRSQDLSKDASHARRPD